MSLFPRFIFDQNNFTQVRDLDLTLRQSSLQLFVHSSFLIVFVFVIIATVFQFHLFILQSHDILRIVLYILFEPLFLCWQLIHIIFELPVELGQLSIFLRHWIPLNQLLFVVIVQSLMLDSQLPVHSEELVDFIFKLKSQGHLLVERLFSFLIVLIQNLFLVVEVNVFRF